MPYADKAKQKAYMRDWARNYQRRKTARLKELEQLQVDMVREGFEQHSPRDYLKDQLIADLREKLVEVTRDNLDLRSGMLSLDKSLKEMEAQVERLLHKKAVVEPNARSMQPSNKSDKTSEILARQKEHE